MAKQAMNEPSNGRFSSTFLGKIAPAGRKVQGSSRPEIRATSTKDKFVLNEKARLLMGVEVGSRVIMIDQNLKLGAGERLEQNERFFICPAPEGFDEAALIGDTKAFSYSGVWSAMIMNDPEITEASVDDLVRADVGILRGAKMKNYVGTKIAAGEVIRYTEEDEEGKTVDLFELIEGYPAVPVFRITNIEFKNHDPKSTSDEEGD